MGIVIQFNKTAMNKLRKDLAIRVLALPTLVAKESALRLEVKKAQAAVAEVKMRILALQQELDESARLWNEFPSGLVRVSHVNINHRKIAGIAIPMIRSVEFTVDTYSMFLAPGWLPRGVEYLKKMGKLMAEKKLLEESVRILEQARRKTTQKVNLYEKVQIPEYQEALRKIKRFLEDEENLAKASQKMLKKRIAALEVAS